MRKLAIVNNIHIEYDDLKDETRTARSVIDAARKVADEIYSERKREEDRNYREDD